MSGHSKWHSIKHKKGAADAKRGKIFTKHARLIALAAQQGGGDADMNPGLRIAIDKAKSDNMPNVNIDRAIKRGTGEDKDGAIIEEIMYEGFGPAGTAMLVQTLTDNKNRAVASVKTIMNKNGGNMGSAGSVSWMFERRGVLCLKDISDKEEAELDAIDAGAIDVKEEGTILEIHTQATDLTQVKKSLEGKYCIESAELSFIPKEDVKIEDETEARKIFKLIDALEEDDDVANIYSNFDICEELLSKL